jgi:hypothetical protein
MNTVQIQLKSWDSRIPGFQLDLKIVYEFQLRWDSSPISMSLAIGQILLRTRGGIHSEEMIEMK